MLKPVKMDKHPHSWCQNQWKWTNIHTAGVKTSGNGQTSTERVSKQVALSDHLDSRFSNNREMPSPFNSQQSHKACNQRLRERETERESETEKEELTSSLFRSTSRGKSNLVIFSFS